MRHRLSWHTGDRGAKFEIGQIVFSTPPQPSYRGELNDNVVSPTPYFPPSLLLRERREWIGGRRPGSGGAGRIWRKK